MVETQDMEKVFKFKNELLPNIVVVVNDTVATLNFTDLTTEYNQDQIRELISLLVDTHDHMDNNLQELKEETMNLFDADDDTEELETVETISENDIVVNDTKMLLEITSNATAFLYMTEDYAEGRLGQSEITKALHILRDSINSYLEESSERGSEPTNDIQPEQQETV